MTKYNDYSKEINKFFNIDLYNASPEFNEVETNLFNGAWKSQSENFNVITNIIIYV